MTALLEHIADWITGGGLRARDEEIERVSALAEKLRESRDFHERAGKSADFMLGCFQADTARLSEALDEIAAMETPYANATVRRMAARAREAL